jgi:hypothetical protein
MREELRKHTRSQARKGAFATFYKPDETESLMLGEIVDISEGGLGICYIDVEERYNESLEVSIYGLEKEGFLDRMPCRIIYDMHVPEDSLAVLSVRRCGIKFESLPRERLDELGQFIRNIKLDPAESSS